MYNKLRSSKSQVKLPVRYGDHVIGTVEQKKTRLDEEVNVVREEVKGMIDAGERRKEEDVEEEVKGMIDAGERRKEEDVELSMNEGEGNACDGGYSADYDINNNENGGKMSYANRVNMNARKRNNELDFVPAGGRGLKQGDPMSLYLVYNGHGLKEKTRDNGKFKCHVGYTEMKLTHLCLAHDLLVLCNGDLNSVIVIEGALEEFNLCCGLVPNLGKSTVFYAPCSSGLIELLWIDIQMCMHSFFFFQVFSQWDFLGKVFNETKAF
nr:hypothetical protein [Tanacetum cinerariifolium]